MISRALQEAGKLDQIDFPEFTNKLVDDVYSTLVNSQIEQTEAFIELIKQTSKTLTTYINDTKDDISGEEVLAFVTRVLPSFDVANVDNESPTVALTADEQTEFTSKTDVPGIPNPVNSSTPTREDFLEAVTNRLAANKYRLLTEMLKTGLVRLVVRDGEIETRLRFTTNEFSLNRSNASTITQRSSGFNANVGVFAKAFNVKASANFSKLNVSTTNTSSTNVANTSVNIGGRVFIKFKSDFQPLGTPIG